MAAAVEAVAKGMGEAWVVERAVRTSGCRNLRNPHRMDKVSAGSQDLHHRMLRRMNGSSYSRSTRRMHAWVLAADSKGGEMVVVAAVVAVTKVVLAVVAAVAAPQHRAG